MFEITRDTLAALLATNRLRGRGQNEGLHYGGAGMISAEIIDRLKQIDALNTGELGCFVVRPFGPKTARLVDLNLITAKPAVLSQDAPDYDPNLRFAAHLQLTDEGRALMERKEWFQLVEHPDLLLMQAAPELLAENERLRARVAELEAALFELGRK